MPLNGTGDFKVSFRVPESAPVGGHAVSVRCLTGDVRLAATKTFSVPPAHPPSSPPALPTDAGGSGPTAGDDGAPLRGGLADTTNILTPDGTFAAVPPGGAGDVTGPVTGNLAPVATAMEAMSSASDVRQNSGEMAEPGWPSSAFAAAVPAANEVPFGVAAVLLSLGVTALLSILLIGFPAEMFNKTLLEHYEEIRGWFRWVPGWLTAAPERSPLLQFALFTVLATTVATFLEPGAGLDRETLPLALSFLVTIPLVTLAYALPAEIYYRRISGARAKLQVLPLSLGAAVLCAAVTRIGHFLPGYVYGLMAEYRGGQGRRLEKQHEGRGLLIGAVVVFGVSLLAWQLAGATDAAAASDTASFGVRFGDNVLKQTFVVGLEGLVFALIPLRLLDGDKLKAWSLTAWTIVYGLTLFVFVHVLVVTRWLEDQDRAGVVRMLALFVAFALLSLSFWAYFNFRRPRTATMAGTP